MKFNHKASNLADAIGVQPNDAGKQMLDFVFGRDTSGKAKAAAIVGTGLISEELGCMLSDLTGIEFNTASEVVEYLYKSMTDDAIRSILAKKLVVENE